MRLSWPDRLKSCNGAGEKSPVPLSEAIMYIIIKDKSRRFIKGRNITDMAHNLQSEGWPSEFSSEEAFDRAKFIENREGRILNKDDMRKINHEMNK
jgi:hypothetical protein